MNFCMASTRPVSLVRAVDVLDLGAPLRPVGQQFDDRRLVRDQRAYPVRVCADQRQPDDGPAAAAEDVHRFAADRLYSSR